MSLLPALAQAQAPRYDQAQLDALLAPVALYPDDVVRLVLDASTAPGQVAEAAQWSRVNRGMTGDDAVRAAQEYRWQPAVTALVAYPDLLERMAESPQWTFDLGNAWLAQQAEVMNTVQSLRQRAYASGALQSDAYQTVQSSAEGIVVVPARPYIYYVPYYDPFVVYGGWWWPAYRPVYWRPWHPRPVFVTNVVVVNRGFRDPVVFAQHSNVSPAARFQAQNSAAFVARTQAANRPSQAAQFQNRSQPRVQVQPFHSHVAPAFPRQQQMVQRPAIAAHQQFHRQEFHRQSGQRQHIQQHRGRS